MEFGEIGMVIRKALGVKSPVRQRTEQVIGFDRRLGSRGAKFPEDNLILGNPTNKPTKPNTETMTKPPPPTKPRTPRDVEFGIG